MPKAHHTPERSCVSCGQKLPKRELTRIVRTPEGKIEVDPSGRSAGRGSYLCPDLACWNNGAHKGRLERALRASLSSQDRELLLNFYHNSVAETIPVEG